jgi:hypothetical protein
VVTRCCRLLVTTLLADDDDDDDALAPEGDSAVVAPPVASGAGLATAALDPGYDARLSRVRMWECAEAACDPKLKPPVGGSAPGEANPEKPGRRGPSPRDAPPPPNADTDDDDDDDDADAGPAPKPEKGGVRICENPEWPKR